MTPRERAVGVDHAMQNGRCRTHGGPDAHLGTGCLDCPACRVDIIEAALAASDKAAEHSHSLVITDIHGGEPSSVGTVQREFDEYVMASAASHRQMQLEIDAATQRAAVAEVRAREVANRIESDAFPAGSQYCQWCQVCAGHAANCPVVLVRALASPAITSSDDSLDSHKEKP